MNSPYKWVVVAYLEDGKYTDRVLCSYKGVYEDAWRMSSPITKVTETNDTFIFRGSSGSRYTCYKDRWGLSSLTRDVLSNFPEGVILLTNKYRTNDE